MYLTLWLFAVISAAAVNAEYDEECLKIPEHLNTRFNCCKKLFRVKPTENSDQYFQSCVEEQRKTRPSYDFHICLANKRGYATLDGNLNKKGYETFTEKAFDTNPELMANIKEKCINGDVSKFGPDEDSELIKSEMCMVMQMALQCPEWDDSDSCKGMEDLVKKCA